MVRIILNADDFGKSVTRNQAIDDSFKQGLIRSAGLIVTGKHLYEGTDGLCACMTDKGRLCRSTYLRRKV